MAHPAASATPHVSEKRLWFGIFAGPAAWAVHGLTGVILSSNACEGDISHHLLAVRWALGVVTIALLAVAVAGAVVAYHSWTILSGHRKVIGSEAPGRQEYMALIGLFSSVVFTLGLVWGGLPTLLVDLCDPRH